MAISASSGSKHERNLEVEIFGLNARGIERGRPQGRPLLCLHGWLDNLASFQPLFPFLEEEFFVRAFDFPGHGLSDPEPGRVPYHFIDSMIWLDDLLDQMGWDKCTLLGHSMGGAVASLFASVRPKRVERMILIDALGPLSNREEQTFEQLERYLNERKLYATKRPRVYRSKEEMVKSRAQFGPLPLESARLLVERGSKEVPEGYVFRSDPRLRLPAPVRMTEGQIAQLLPHIECPTLFIEAQPGMNIGKWAELKKRMALIPDLQHVVVEGGHHLHMQKPAEIWKLIKGFI